MLLKANCNKTHCVQYYDANKIKDSRACFLLNVNCLVSYQNFNDKIKKKKIINFF